MNKKILAWHFLKEDKRLQFENDKGVRTKVRTGQTLKFKGEPILCHQGLHAAIRLIDALQYAPGSVLCRVELGGKIVKGDDKLAATERKVLWMLNADTVLREFACWAAEETLLAERKAGREPHSDSFKAIEVKRLFLKGKATAEELHAAYSAAYSAADCAADSAAYSAACSAAYCAARSAADCAAYSAAYCAARSAAYSAACSAAYSAACSAAYCAARSAAYCAARSAADCAQNKRLEKMITAAYRKQTKR